MENCSGTGIQLHALGFADQSELQALRKVRSSHGNIKISSWRSHGGIEANLNKHGKLLAGQKPLEESLPSCKQSYIDPVGKYWALR